MDKNERMVDCLRSGDVGWSTGQSVGFWAKVDICNSYGGEGGPKVWRWYLRQAADLRRSSEDAVDFGRRQGNRYIQLPHPPPLVQCELALGGFHKCLTLGPHSGPTAATVLVHVLYQVRIRALLALIPGLEYRRQPLGRIRLPGTMPPQLHLVTCLQTLFAWYIVVICRTRYLF